LRSSSIFIFLRSSSIFHFFWGCLSNWVKIRLHTKNQLRRLSGRALKVTVVWDMGGPTNNLVYPTRVEVESGWGCGWAVTKTPNVHEIQLVDSVNIEGDGEVLLGPGALLVSGVNCLLVSRRGLTCKNIFSISISL
jgi:hypothetical protein